MSYIKYNQLANDGKIYALIDTVNVVFENCRLSDIFRWLQLEDALDDFLATCYNSSRGFVDLSVFCYNGIRIEIYEAFNFMVMKDDYSILDCVFPKFRVDISGSGHDYLRSRGIDFASYRYVVPMLPEGASYHYTRFDFAYDFVNYKPEFMDELINHINNHHLPNGRIPLCAYSDRQGTAISASVRTVSQRTVYLGSPQSDRMLRIYDKSMEQRDRRTGVYLFDNPYNDPDSWFRIELQMRRDVAHALSIPCSDTSVNSFEAVLKDVMQRYSFADPDHDVSRSCRPPVEFWSRLFDWSDITDRLIIPNENRVESCDPDVRLHSSFVRSHLKSFMEFVTQFGIDELNNVCRKSINALYDPSVPNHLKRRYAYLTSISQYSVISRLNENTDPGYSVRHGRLCWNDLKI